MKTEPQRLVQETNEPEQPAKHMAAAIIEHMKQNGECSIKHLRVLGFSLDDIARHWPEACKIVENSKRSQ